MPVGVGGGAEIDDRVAIAVGDDVADDAGAGGAASGRGGAGLEGDGVAVDGQGLAIGRLGIGQQAGRAGARGRDQGDADGKRRGAVTGRCAVPTSVAEMPPSVVAEVAAVVPPAAPENSTLEVAVALV